MSKPTVVYTAWPTSGRALYVGSTCEIRGRLAQHAKTSEWWADLFYVEVSDPMPREDARIRERDLIWSLRPQFNLTHNLPTAPESIDPESLPALVNVREVARLFGVRPAVIEGMGNRGQLAYTTTPSGRRMYVRESVIALAAARAA